LVALLFGNEIRRKFEKVFFQDQRQNINNSKKVVFSIFIEEITIFILSVATTFTSRKM